MPFLKCHSYKKPRSRMLEDTAHKQGHRHAIVTPMKDTFVGDWDRSNMQGFGAMMTRSKRIYEGDWLKNFRHGFGISGYLDNDEAKIVYRGDWKYGHYNGYGCKHFSDGGYFCGYFKNSKRHGYGSMWYADGGYYDGDWVKDLREGLGMQVYPSGNRYEGEWKGNRKNGKGRFYHLVTGQVQEGVWVDNVCVSSIMMDIPFRQAVKEPTQYPIAPTTVIDPDEIFNREVTLIEELLATKSIQPEEEEEDYLE